MTSPRRTDPARISPKVAVPSITLAIATIASAVISGDWSGSETALGIATCATFLLGYIPRDPARG